MKRQIIEFVTFTERRVISDNTEAFQFRKDRPARWLQKACFFVLRKLRAHYLEKTISIERHAIDASTFIDRLFKQMDGIQGSFNRTPAKLLIGAEDYANLMHEMVATQPFSFSAEYGYRREILGLEVQVIPWMRGCLVMPEPDSKKS